MLADHRSAPIDEAHRALFTFVEKMNRQSTSIGQADVDALKSHGWSEEAIYDAITVCALFRFYNAWIDAAGVRDLPAEAYAMSATRMAAQGYVR